MSASPRQESIKYFFTFVWGPPGEPAWPLTFASKAARTIAKREVSEGDWVFTVGTKREPTVPEHRGRVLGVYQVSDLEVNTQDYADQLPKNDVKDRGVSNFPYGLHPIAAWEISSPNNDFSDLVGVLSGGSYLQARSTVVELDQELAKPLLSLERRSVALAQPKTALGLGRLAQKISKLAPKHEGEFLVSSGKHTVWYVYALVLADVRGNYLAFKIGYSHEPENRKNEYNKAMAAEVTGLTWQILLKQPLSSEDEARAVEQQLLKTFAANKLQSNSEIVSGIKETSLHIALAAALR